MALAAAGMAALPASAPADQFASEVISIPVGGTPNSIADGDFNADGDPDLVAGRYSAGSVAVSLGEPGFDFGPVTVFPAGGNPAALGSADLTGTATRSCSSATAIPTTSRC